MTLDSLKLAIEAAVPGSRPEIIPNASPSNQHSLLVEPQYAVATAEYLRDAEHLRLDYCSNVTGIDWPAAQPSGKPELKEMEEGMEQDIEEESEIQDTGHLEAVYHLYSMEKKHGPVILRMRTRNRGEQVHLPSLTPVWRSAEFQEREIFDLYGIIFDGHPDLRRILMWDGFVDHPMRRDYVEPDDYEYEPTAHQEVLQKTMRHQSRTVS